MAAEYQYRQASAAPASQRQKRVLRYRYEIEGAAALQPELIPDRKPLRKKRERPKRVQNKKQNIQRLEDLRVRPAEGVAPAGVAGLMLAMVMAVLILQGQIQLNSLNNQVVSARSELSELQEVEDQLNAQYEQLFDMQGIESDMLNSGKMIQPGTSQQIYLDLSEPDSTTVYSSSGLLGGLKSLLSGLAEFFH